MKTHRITQGPMKGYWITPGSVTTGNWVTGQYITADGYWSIDGSVKYRWTCQPYRLLSGTELHRTFRGAPAICAKVKVRSGRTVSGPAWFRAPRMFLYQRRCRPA